MIGVSWISRETVWRILSVVTIVSTVLPNSVLFLKMRRAAGGSVCLMARGHRGARLLTLVSMMLGDLFAALFSHVVIHVNSLLSLHASCRIVNVSTLYLLYLLPLVYGSGLAVLAVEGIIFRLRVNTLNPLVVNLLVSAVPWAIGFSVVVFIVLKDSHFDICGLGLHRSRRKFLCVTCQLLPVVISLLVTIVCLVIIKIIDRLSALAKYQGMLVRGISINLEILDKEKDNEPVRLDDEIQTDDEGPAPAIPPFPPPTDINSFHSKSNEDSPFTPIVEDFGLLNEGSSTDPQQTGHEESNENSPSPSPPLPPTQNLSRILNASPRCSDAGFVSRASIVSYSPDGQHLSLTLPTPSTSPYLMNHENAALLLAALTFAACVLPNPVVSLMVQYTRDYRSVFSPRTSQHVLDVCFWLLSFRSFVSPLVWMLSKNFSAF
ncbi:hypothetical protein ElyMa_000005400 [Elysia marginata]|uniref:G-protein coupled receptors family 1 profile domain-containing protein n=1 Tax=Elysia marginata TaxID=1093978 RepID=A0AAV4EA08_9GAST|nr:hypothetical protein ElyMa_000005400 [Elysia marginata]